MKSKTSKTKQNRPTPPDDLDGEALLEWHRVADELDAAGTLDRTDRAILSVYCRTWAVWSAAARVVAADGPVVLLPNNWPGQSPEAKVMDASGKQLDKLLDRLGLTPSSRKRSAGGAGRQDDDGPDLSEI
jgi:P27 family predicted phage terminase small subunit